MVNIIIGLCLLCLGIFGVVANWWAVIDLIGVVVPVVLVFVGLLSILAGASGRKRLRRQESTVGGGR